MLIRAIIVTLFILCILCSIVELGLSFSQITDKSTNPGYTPTFCSDMFSPLKITFLIDEKDYFLFCGWTNRLSAERIIVYFIIIWNIFGLIYTVIKKKSVYYMMSSIVFFMCGVAAMYTAIYDSIKIKETKNNCEFIKTSLGICDFKYFYATIALNYLTSILVIITSCIILKFRSKLFDLYSTSSSSSSSTNFTNQQEDNYSKFQIKPVPSQQQQHVQILEESVSPSNNNNNNDNGAVLLAYDPYPSYAANYSSI